jgi:3-hydroxyisobutyrate dehydrogenase-like beta-hydroxyacid dehydrogenase
MTSASAKGGRVSVIGLGNMGAALAQALLNAGYQVTVWNRTVEKAAALGKAGAEIATSATAAALASPLTVVCATDMGASKLIYRTPEFAAAIKGRTLADLSTGTAQDARESSRWVQAAGGRYVDGGILCYPRDVGTAEASVLYAGDGSAFREHEQTLKVLAGAQRHLADEPGAAATVYLALWSFYFGSIAAYFEAGALAAAAGIPVDRFQELASGMMPKLADGIADATSRVKEKNFAGDQAPIDIYVDNLILVRDAFAAERVSHLTVEAFLTLLQAAKQAGDGDKDLAAVFARAIARA